MKDLTTITIITEVRQALQDAAAELHDTRHGITARREGYLLYMGRYITLMQVWEVVDPDTYAALSPMYEDKAEQLQDAATRLTKKTA